MRKLKAWFAAHAWLTELLRFVLTGGVCFLIEFAALVLLREGLHLPVLVATPIAFAISVAANYLLCVVWVFRGEKSGGAKTQAGFFLTSLIGLALNQLFMWIFCSLLGEDTLLFTLAGRNVTMYMLNKTLATLLVMVWNYFTKRLVLRPRAGKGA